MFYLDGIKSSNQSFSDQEAGGPKDTEYKFYRRCKKIHQPLMLNTIMHLPVFQFRQRKVTVIMYRQYPFSERIRTGIDKWRDHGASKIKERPSWHLPADRIYNFYSKTRFTNQPDYWDPNKIIHQINEKRHCPSSVLGAIDLFSFAPTRKTLLKTPISLIPIDHPSMELHWWIFSQEIIGQWILN